MKMRTSLIGLALIAVVGISSSLVAKTMLFGTFCMAKEKPAAVAAKYWQWPSLNWASDQPFTKTLGKNQSQRYTCRHFIAQEGGGNGWKIKNNGNNKFTLNIYTMGNARLTNIPAAQQKILFGVNGPVFVSQEGRNAKRIYAKGIKNVNITSTKGLSVAQFDFIASPLDVELMESEFEEEMPLVPQAPPMPGSDPRTWGPEVLSAEVVSESMTVPGRQRAYNFPTKK